MSMNIEAIYSFDGRLPAEEGFYFCMYVTLQNEPVLGVARVEYDMIDEEMVWRCEVPDDFRGGVPYCYFRLSGELTIELQTELERCGRIAATFLTGRNSNDT